MSQFKEIAVGGTVYFWFAANGTDGAADDGATPLCNVRLAGAAASAAPTATPTPTLLTHATYLPGSYEIAIDTTGFAEGEYGVFNSLTISTVNPGGFVGSVVVRAAASTLRDNLAAVKSDTAAILVDTGTTLDGRIPAALTANGNMKCSLVEILTTALTETAGLLAGGFKQFFNVATPTGTVNEIKSNMKKINDVAIVGNGAGTPFNV